MITIGVLGSRGKSTVSEIIEETIKKQYNERVCVIGTREDSSKAFSNLKSEKIDYLIILISREDILEKRLDDIKFDIVVETSLDEESIEVIEEVQNIMCNIKENGYFIFNSDSIHRINFKCDKIYPITYGLNGKTTVTASSIDDIENLCFSYCLQRTLFTIKNSVVQPFEKPMKVKGTSEDIYPYLAAYTCLLLIGCTF